MANSSMRQLAQMARETTAYGTVGSNWKRFTSFGLSPSANLGVATAQPRGQTAVTQGWVSREDSSFGIEGGVLSYDEVVYLLDSVCNSATQTGALATGYTRVHTIDQFTPSTFMSYSIEQGQFGSPQRVYRALGGILNEWGFTLSSADDQIGMTGSFIAKKMDIQGSPGSGTGTSYEIAIPKQFTLGYATTYAGLSAATSVSNAFSCAFGISDRRSLVRYLGNVSGEPSDTVETAPGLTFDLTLADETAPVDTFLTRARAGQKIYFRVKGTGGPITGSTGPVNHSLQLDISAVLRDSPSIDETDGVQSVTFPLAAAYDATSGKIFEITTLTGLAGLT